MSIRQICAQIWNFEGRDLSWQFRHIADSRHHCGLAPGHDGPCVCRECGDSPTLFAEG